MIGIGDTIDTFGCLGVVVIFLLIVAVIFFAFNGNIHSSGAVPTPAKYTAETINGITCFKHYGRTLNCERAKQ